MEIIDYYTAVLAKEKGFDLECYSRYSEEKLITSDIKHNHNNTSDKCNAPEQFLLQKWLREEHNIDIIIYVNINRHVEYYYFPSLITLAPNKLSLEETDIQGHFFTYEDALEKALFCALQLINNQ